MIAKSCLWWCSSCLVCEVMGTMWFDHVGVVVDNPEAATAFFVDLMEVSKLNRIVARPRADGFDTVGELLNDEGLFRLCDVRGPGGLIVEPVEKIASKGASKGSAGSLTCLPRHR